MEADCSEERPGADQKRRFLLILDNCNHNREQNMEQKI